MDIHPNDATCAQTCQPVLSKETTDYPDVGGARSLRPSDAVETSCVDERAEDELATLMRRRLCKDGNNERGGRKKVPPHRDVAQAFEKAQAKCVDSTCIEVGHCQGSGNGHTVSYLEGRGPRRRSRWSYANWGDSSYEAWLQ